MSQQQQEHERHNDKEYVVDEREDEEETSMADEEISEEEDDDFIEDVQRNKNNSNVISDEEDGNSYQPQPTTRSSLRPVTDTNAALTGGDDARRVVNASSVGDDEEGGGAMPVLLEGDYFPQTVPAGVLAELRACHDDDADDFMEVEEAHHHAQPKHATPPQQPHATTDSEHLSASSSFLGSSAPSSTATSTVTHSSTVAEASVTVTSPSTLTPIDLDLLSPHSSPSHTVTRAVEQQQLATSQPLLPPTAMSSVGSSGASGSGVYVRASPSSAASAVVVPPRSSGNFGGSSGQIRKRVRWVDDVQLSSGKTTRAAASRSLVHHASSFTIPGHFQTPSQHNIDSQRISAPRTRSAAAEHQLLHAPVQVFREVVNDDRSIFYACRPQRPSQVFSQWKQAALKHPSDVVVAQPSTLDMQENSEEPSSSVLPNTRTIPSMFMNFIRTRESSLSGSTQQQQGQNEGVSCQGWAPTSAQLYRYIHRDAPPLVGTISLHANERFATRMLNLSIPKAVAASNEGTAKGNEPPFLPLDDDGLICPPMWAGITVPLEQYPSTCLLPDGSGSGSGGDASKGAAAALSSDPAALVDAPLCMHW
ncbi:Hypothetical protein, putative [Bodo saltans]|uniref:Uncharacterized protein n=1 Tax=Bodo saltans TaxID=75058 RepID=A0A0S4J9K5_BODSA|nr:Hypothetical protein, putative [Bodo saltans]|eukprot:CUG87159.1 Hypothetical protein, putative [Bodo saltans]